MIGIDTYSWGKLIKLKSMTNWDSIIDELLTKLDWFVTVEGKKEFQHFYPDQIQILDKGTILPVLNIRLKNFIEEGFDLNDASLLEYAILRNYRIITEDRPLIGEAIYNKVNIVFLIDFFLELTETNKYFSKREFYHLIKLFKKWKNIKKDKARKLETRRKII